MPQVMRKLSECVEDLHINFLPCGAEVGGRSSQQGGEGGGGGGVRGEGEEGVQLVGSTGHMIRWDIGMSVCDTNSVKTVQCTSL